MVRAFSYWQNEGWTLAPLIGKIEGLDPAENEI
jgi:hypothetical protein